MPRTIKEAWQQAVPAGDTAAMSKLLNNDASLVHQQVIHTRGDGTTYGVLPLEMVNKLVVAVKLLVDAGANPNHTDDGNALPIHNASPEAMRCLLHAGANVHKIGYEQCTPVMYETYMGNHDGVQLLIDHGADVNYQRNLDGFTSLQLAAKKYDRGLVNILLPAGADVSLRNTDGETAADIARERGDEEIVNILENIR